MSSQYYLYIRCYHILEQRAKRMESLLKHKSEVFEEENIRHMRGELNDIYRRMEVMRSGAERHKPLPKDLQDWLKQDTCRIGSRTYDGEDE